MPLASAAARTSPTSAAGLPVRLLPWLLLVALLALALAVLLPRLRPLRAVVVVAVATAPGSGGGSVASGTVAVQASGWTEPEPAPVQVVARTAGVVARVAVRDGETVRAGQELAVLDPADADLALHEAQAAVALAAAGIESARAQQAAAAARVRAEQARLDEARAQAERLARAGPAVAAGDAAQAGHRLAAQVAAVAAAEAEAAQAATGIATAEAAVTAARIAGDRAALARERCVLRAPIDGVVMRLLAVPGQHVGDDHMVVAELYDPARLQVRVDVPLGDAARVQPGQRAEVLVELWPERVFAGEVVRVVGIADVARNTLQAKVRLEAPAPELRPDMLARVRLLEPPRPTPVDGGARAAPWAPEDGLVITGGAASALVVGVDGRIEPRAVTLGTGRRPGWIEVVDGLRPGEPVVVGDRAGLAPGQRVRAQREER